MKHELRTAIKVIPGTFTMEILDKTIKVKTAHIYYAHHIEHNPPFDVYHVIIHFYTFSN